MSIFMIWYMFTFTKILVIRRSRPYWFDGANLWDRHSHRWCARVATRCAQGEARVGDPGLVGMGFVMRRTPTTPNEVGIFASWWFKHQRPEAGLGTSWPTTIRVHTSATGSTETSGCWEVVGTGRSPCFSTHPPRKYVDFFGETWNGGDMSSEKVLTLISIGKSGSQERMWKELKVLLLLPQGGCRDNPQKHEITQNPTLGPPA